VNPDVGITDEPTVPRRDWLDGDIAGVAGGLGAGAGFDTVMVMGAVVSSGLVPLEAFTVKVYAPAVVGVPARVAPLNVRPGGRDPDDRVKVTGVVPDAAKVYPGYAVPTVAVVGGVSAVNVGGVPVLYLTMTSPDPPA
jgi:phage shock protein PspC (stress-responsive transcriptional regulator)